MEEYDFYQALNEAGLPVSEEQQKKEFQTMADESGLAIANPSKYSAFWVFTTSAAVRPVQWLMRFLAEHVMPNCYVKTASGVYLDLLAWGYGLSRKEASKTRGKITFTSSSTQNAVTIPAGTAVRTAPVNGKIFRMITETDAVIPQGSNSVQVPAAAEEAGAAYNLGAGYYCYLDSDVPGISAAVNESGYLTDTGTDTEPDDELRLRIQFQFASVGDYHIDAKYKAMISARTGFPADRIFLVTYEPNSFPCRGPGSANAYVLFDAEAVSEEKLAEVNRYISTDGNHGHGDDVRVLAMPYSRHDVALTCYLDLSMSPERRAAVQNEIENMIRCAFRGNSAYTDQVTQTMPYSRFSFSQLDHELHGGIPEIESLVWGQDDIISELDVPVLNTLAIEWK